MTLSRHSRDCIEPKSLNSRCRGKELAILSQNPNWVAVPNRARDVLPNQAPPRRIRQVNHRDIFWADIQAMGEGEAKTTASKEMETAQQLMAKNDMEGCKSHIHSAMEATEK